MFLGHLDDQQPGLHDDYTWTPAKTSASITYPSGRTVSYARNTLGQISSIAARRAEHRHRPDVPREQAVRRPDLWQRPGGYPRL